MKTFNDESEEKFDSDRCSDEEKLVFTVPLALHPIKTYLK